MRSRRIALLLGIVLAVAGAHLAVSALEPEFGRDLALRQFESIDLVRQQMRSYEFTKRFVLTALDLALPLACVTLFFSEIVNWLRPKEVK